MDKLSGKHWVTWADTHAKNSKELTSLNESFKTDVDAFIGALEKAGATVSVNATKRSDRRAYLFHWSWKIALEKCKPSDADLKVGVDIQWDHGNLAKSLAGAKEMVNSFRLAVPPRSNVAPSLTSNHIAGNAVDMTITWSGIIKVQNKRGKEISIPFDNNVNTNSVLHSVGESFGVLKHKSDAPHWSHNGR